MTASELLDLGNACLERQDFDGAKKHYLAAIAEDAGCVPALQNLATVALKPGHTAATIALLKRAILADPKNRSAWSSLGGALWRAQRFDEAESALAKAYELGPNWVVNYRKGLLDYAQGKASHARTQLCIALNDKPDEACLRLDFAHAVLKDGDLAKGLDLLEARWDGPLQKGKIWDSGIPRWTGDKLPKGSVLILHHEQGFGDTIQFCRFIPAIKAMAGNPHLSFSCPRQLHRLLEGQCGIDDVIGDDEAIVIDAEDGERVEHCPLISAVALLKPTYASLPGTAAYLSARTARIDFRHGGAGLAVGVCWRGSETPWRGDERSVDVEELLELGTVPGVKLWSLQSGQRAADLQKTGADCLISEVEVGLGDFGQTAAIINALDLVVTVDTAIAHLAGALGKPVFMLNPVTPCWRWCNGAAPWYASMTIFNQTQPRTWSAPIAQIRDRLAEMVPQRAGVHAQLTTP